VINSSAGALFQLWINSTVTGANNNSFVNGPVRRFGTVGLTFPVGKGASYRPIILGSATPNLPFWTENFGTANCTSQGTLASGYAGVNGAWTITNTGVNGGFANTFFISSTEAGMGPGICGDGCLSNPALNNRTLHVGNVANSTNACSFCPTGDCGASYDASASGAGACAACTFFASCCTTSCNNSALSDQRAESPVINCTGQVGISLGFNYMENGEGTNDNATLWYFDGAVWSQLLDLPKTLAGSCGGQGAWTPYTALLPASANNNPNIKIGFRWVNDENNVGSDPSFAVDDINLYIPSTSTFTAEYFPANPQVPYGNVLVPSLTAISNCEYWILDRNAGVDARMVGLTWNAASCNAAQYTTFEVARWDNISGIWQDHNGVLSGPPSATSGIVTSSAPVANFSPFAIAFVPAPLPVEMETVSIKCEDGMAVLKWQTASEINNDHFALERSSDAISWEEIGRVDGAGNSNSQLAYSWVDMDPLVNGYYRIKQVDYDGQFKIYAPLHLACTSKQNWVNVYPNPSSGTVNIEINNGNHLEAVMIYSSLGQFNSNVSMNSMYGKSTFPVDISFLEPGTYYLRLLVNGEWISKPVVIIR